MQLLFETFFYISYRFDDTRLKQKNRFFFEGVYYFPNVQEST